MGSELDKLFDERDIQTVSQDERSFNASFLGMFSAVLRALDIVSGVILVIMTLILGNTIAMGVRERTNEYGVLKAIGFRPPHIAMFIIGEALLVALLGACSGATPLVPARAEGARGIARVERWAAVLPVLQHPAVVAALALALSVGLGLSAALIPAIRASRLQGDRRAPEGRR